MENIFSETSCSKVYFFQTSCSKSIFTSFLHKNSFPSLLTKKASFSVTKEVKAIYDATLQKIQIDKERRCINAINDMYQKTQKDNYIGNILSEKDKLVSTNEKLKNKVIILKKVEGISLNEFFVQIQQQNKISKSKIIETREALKQLEEKALWECLYGNNDFVQADWHLGNIMVSNMENEEKHVIVTPIDFGACINLNEEFKEKKTLRTILRQYEEVWNTFKTPVHELRNTEHYLEEDEVQASENLVKEVINILLPIMYSSKKKIN